MRGHVVLIALGASLCGVTAARAQSAACDAPSSLIERVYIELINTPTLPSGQLLIRLNDSPPVPRDKDGSGHWFIDLWNSGVLKPARADALDGNTVQVSKAGWQFTPITRSSPRSEQVGGASRCAVTVTFTTSELWQVKVTAEPSGRANPVFVECPRFCGQNTKTDFDTEWMTVRDRLRIDADFGAACKVPLIVSMNELRASADGVFRLTRRALLERIPRACVSRNYVLIAVVQRIPGDGISFRQIIAR